MKKKAIFLLLLTIFAQASNFGDERKKGGDDRKEVRKGEENKEKRDRHPIEQKGSRQLQERRADRKDEHDKHRMRQSNWQRPDRPKASKAEQPRQEGNDRFKRPGQQHFEQGKSTGQERADRFEQPRRFDNSREARRQVRQFIQDHPVTQRQANAFNRPDQAVRHGKRTQGYAGARYRHSWFNNNFWQHHRYYPRYYTAENNWWASATPLGIGSWLGWQAMPYYYATSDDYADSRDYAVPVSVEDRGPTSLLNYAAESQLIDHDNETNPQWMPLGVFSVVKEGDSADSPTLFLQLVLSKEGSIAGTFYDAAADQVYAIDGLVDADSQRAVWKVANSDGSPIMEAGIYNLTQEAAPARLYLPNGTAQNRLLIRLDAEQ